jgi:hypothetical protein
MERNLLELKMDEDFPDFLKLFGSAVHRQDVPETAFAKYKNKLPDQLLEYWRVAGWSGFADGLFWLVNPEEWDEPMEMMLDGTGFLEQDAYHVIARNAFGDLWLWGEKTGDSLSIISAYGMAFPRFNDVLFKKLGKNIKMQYFFGNLNLENVDLLDEKQKYLFKRAYKKLGPLAANEVYGFVPLVGMGGKCVLENLQKLEAGAHMSILAQMTQMRVMPDYSAEAKKQGF